MKDDVFEMLKRLIRRVEVLEAWKRKHEAKIHVIKTKGDCE